MKHNQTENIEKIFTEICKDLEFQTFNILKIFCYSFIDTNKPKISLKLKIPQDHKTFTKTFQIYQKTVTLSIISSHVNKIVIAPSKNASRF